MTIIEKSQDDNNYLNEIFDSPFIETKKKMCQRIFHKFCTRVLSKKQKKKQSGFL